MLLVLDTNQFLFAFGLKPKDSCVELLDAIAELPSIKLRVPRLVIDEIRRNLPSDLFKECLSYITDLTKIDENSVVPFELGFKYETLGLKAADALIGAYVEYVEGEILVSENRHFLSRQSGLPFKVLTSEKCLSLLKKSK